MTSGANKPNKKFIKITVIVILTVATLAVMRACADRLLYDVGRDEEFTSPNGETTITLRYDFVSRPFLFYQGKQVFSYNENGFNETVFFEVEWITDSTIKLYCDQFDIKYYISLT